MKIMDTDVTRLTRDQAIELAGLAAVERVEEMNCEPTNRLLQPGYEDLTEWSATISINDDGTTLTIYYMTSEDDEDMVERVGGDWGAIDWGNRIAGYEVI